MDEPNFSKYNIDACIEAYMDGNLNRFLRKHRKQYYFQLTYSRTFKRWKKGNKKTKAMRKIRNLLHDLPGEVNHATNIMITLNQEYGWEINKDNASISVDIYLMLSKDILKYNQKRNTSKFLHSKMISQKQAIREQLARGFVLKRHFVNRDKEFAHIYSTANKKLVYPRNILSNPIKLRLRIKSQKMEKQNLAFDTIYRGLSSIGVEGHTRVNNPKKY